MHSTDTIESSGYILCPGGVIIRSLIVFGTRPEAIKLAPLAKTAPSDTFIYYTNQQGEMGLRAWLTFHQTQPIVGVQAQEPNDIMLSLFHYQTEIRKQIREREIELVICQGDTLTAFATAGAAYFERIPLAHVEAGLTTENHLQPFPEEIFRNVIDTLSTYLFAPTSKSFSRLKSRKYKEQQIHLVGNTIVDALLLTNEMQKANLDNNHSKQEQLLTRPTILVTMHRRESFGQPVIDFIGSLKNCIEKVNCDFIIIRHPNPAMLVIDTELAPMNYQNLQILDSLDYPEMYALLQSVDAIVSDSGGLQEEALLLGIPILITREVTERPEILEAGLGTLLYPSQPGFVESMLKFISSIKKSEIKRTINLETALGDGHSAEQIWEILSHDYSVESNI